MSENSNTNIAVNRVYTKEGVHPYDEVTWERRDIVQTNWKTGEVIFEQRGVEFPDFWSINASTIVGTKYFRGAVGTEQREWSLRQVLDRVVGKYVETAKSAGYMNEADAAVFEAELTWMLLHQVFSFNSPVWFNVGTASPQQISACFILAVDDNIDSILNWYREEGLIFKGGSGAGLNLSRLRSSKELLSSGGTASGPVSFMRGADSSAGTIKSGGACLAPSTKVYTTESGPIEVKVLADAGKDFTTLSYDPVLGRVRAVRARAFANGRKQVMRLTTDKGYFDLTPDHPVRLITGEYLEVQNLKKGMSILPIKLDMTSAVGKDKDIRYIRVGLRDGKKGRTTLHRLVAEDLLGYSPASGLEVHHQQHTAQGDHNRFRNGVEDLVILSTSEHKTYHSKCAEERGVHAFQRYHGTKREDISGAGNGMHSSAEFWQDEDKVSTYKENWLNSMQDSGVFVLGQEASSKQKMINMAYKVVNAGGSIDTFDEYYKTRTSLIGKIAKSRKQQLTRIEEKFGTYDNFRDEVRAGNHAVVSIDLLNNGQTTEIYDVEVDSDTPNDRSNLDGHNFLIWSGDNNELVGSGIVVHNTRRAAKMVVLDVDHPDILEFIETKEKEEEKIKALRDAGFDMDLGGKDMFSVQYQNANNSVRVNDKFMKAYEDGANFDLLARADDRVIETLEARKIFRRMAEAAWACADPGIQYDGAINDWHTNPETGRITASNPCSEYLSIDNSSCNLASMNLMKFAKADGTFDSELFTKAVETVITSMEISIAFGDYPTEAITRNTKDYRQLGIGYSNLGALLMSSGMAYDSAEGRAMSASITSLMSAVAYRRSAELAGLVGAYAGYNKNASAHTRVMNMHLDAGKKLVKVVSTGEGDFVGEEILYKNPLAEPIAILALKEWEKNIEIGKVNGWRNAQISVCAPTGCVIGDTLITTDKGLLRISEMADVWGDKWQDLDFLVSTDDGTQKATKFFINGEEITRKITTKAGYKIQGTLAHRIKVVNENTGAWEWKRMADIATGDLVPLQLETRVGETQKVSLPVLEDLHGNSKDIKVPAYMNPKLAEFLGYFMGDGSLHIKGLRLCVSFTEKDVVDRLVFLSKELFNIEPTVTAQEGYYEVAITSVPLTRWWNEAGFTKKRPSETHTGKGWVPHVPYNVRATNDPTIYAAFIRGLFEADGTVASGTPSFSTAKESFADEVRTLLLILGIPTTTRQCQSGMGGIVEQVRVRNYTYSIKFAETIGFISARKQALLITEKSNDSAKQDRIYISDEEALSLVGIEHGMRHHVTKAVKTGKGFTRDMAEEFLEISGNKSLEEALGYIFERVELNEDGGVQPTYDLSVPSNVTYVANGMVSHNTISFMMDCDTTGIEPDFALAKFKKMVGGGSMKIVNNQVAPALKTLGYHQETIESIEAFIAENGHIINAPGLKPEHYSVFDCAVGERAISPMGHIRMMAAVQPFFSGAISKTVNLPESATVEDIEKVYFDGWKLGLKAIAVYRDNCKVGQPLSSNKNKSKGEGKTDSKEEPIVLERVVEKIVERIIEKPARRRLPAKRHAETTSFKLNGAEGYLTAGLYEDGKVGEIFVKMSKQGSTLAGIMDALSISLSLGLQYGVPLEAFVSKFTNMRFEPSGMTGDPDIRMAQSLLDYIFRRLALDHLPYETRAGYGIYTADERKNSLDVGQDYPAIAQDEISKDIGKEATLESLATIVDTEIKGLDGVRSRLNDAPLCMRCGTQTIFTGACAACPSCGETTGCS
jgi:ribonucleoside-diphosphate reductase alpha chain